MEFYYVYRAMGFDTVTSIAMRFGVTEGRITAANPQWKNRVFLFLNAGEEVTLPEGIENAPWFWLNHASVTRRERPPQIQKQTIYPQGWFPPKPSFGSPSSPLSALLTKLGNPKYTVDSPGTYHSPITFTDGWGSKNVSRVNIPQMKGVPYYKIGNSLKNKGSIMFLTRAHKAVQELFDAWEEDGLISLILTYEGSFNPRVIKSGTTPSNHSFGTAFDINGSWNGEGKAPAGIGKKGCLLELVPRANELGFYWGGFYKDGMHFEYAKL